MTSLVELRAKGFVLPSGARLVVSLIEAAATAVAARAPLHEPLDIIMTTDDGEVHILNIVGSSVQRGAVPVALDFAIINVTQLVVVRMRGAELFLGHVLSEIGAAPTD